ncbi:MAG TPA: signal peptide peptidase SppA, partial [Flavisolibacter sp.]|nr:signal peptide peptidase SppA [Flavisolibacter sp.]
MRSFFKIFFASFLALIIFSFFATILLIGIINSLATKSKPEISNKSVLELDLNAVFHERKIVNPYASISGESSAPGVYDVVRLIKNAKNDNKISGIFIRADGNANGFATSNEIRNALLDFKTSKKFVLAYGDVITQKAYYVASAADKIYLNPKGNFEWKGFAIAFAFLKGTLEKLDIKPQIFYAGKYKSATEMFRTEQMTSENKLQTSVWLNSIYNDFIFKIATSRQIDSSVLRNLANTAAIQTPDDAYNSRLVDGLRYDDEIKDDLKHRLGLGKTDRINLISINKYDEAVNLRKSGSERIALIYAEGNIIDGSGTNETIGGEDYIKIIRKVRLDTKVKAIVLRVNSGGGSALASENIWRELKRARAEGKPVVVSFGDVAASGGYYISCGADSIFAQPNTITGSIGVFGIIPDLGSFFKNKLGITFDGVKTSPYADMGAIYRPLNPGEQQQIQKSIERTYMQFKQRVAEGRKKNIEFIDSIAQGRVWIGADAIKIGLVDKMGNLQDAIDCAVRLSKVGNYTIKEYPEQESWLDNLLNRRKDEPAATIRNELGEENFKLYQQLIYLKGLAGNAQARLPFEFYI